MFFSLVDMCFSVVLGPTFFLCVPLFKHILGHFTFTSFMQTISYSKNYYFKIIIVSNYVLPLTTTFLQLL